MTTRKLFPIVGAMAATMTLFAACSGGAAEESTSEEDMATGEATEGVMAPAPMLVGPGCGEYAEMVPDGAGSVEGMAQDPLSVAASNNPLLTNLAAAVSGELNSDVNLVDTLDGGEFTVFAPVDEAFEAIPEDDLNALLGDADALTGVLTYHVVEGQVAPDEIPGNHATVQGEELEVSGSGEELMVNEANVICGGVQTQNAVVYLVDSVLMPPSMVDES